VRAAGELNLKWSMADVDRVARFSISGMSTDQICAALAGTRLESTPQEIDGLLAQIRMPCLGYYPEFAHS
jgi:hypothetical protein